MNIVVTSGLFTWLLSSMAEQRNQWASFFLPIFLPLYIYIIHILQSYYRLVKWSTPFLYTNFHENLCNFSFHWKTNVKIEFLANGSFPCLPSSKFKNLRLWTDYYENYYIKSLYMQRGDPLLPPLFPSLPPPPLPIPPNSYPINAGWQL